MRQILKFSYLLIIFFLCACSPKPLAYDSNGKAIQKADYQGKWIILNYWADWCEPCHLEIPQLNLFYQQHQREAVIFGINFDGLAPTKLQALAQQDHITYPLLTTDIGKHWNIPAIETLPATFVISPQGKLVQQLPGAQTLESLQVATGMH